MAFINPVTDIDLTESLPNLVRLSLTRENTFVEAATDLLEGIKHKLDKKIYLNDYEREFLSHLMTNIIDNGLETKDAADVSYMSPQNSATFNRLIAKLDTFMDDNVSFTKDEGGIYTQEVYYDYYDEVPQKYLQDAINRIKEDKPEHKLDLTTIIDDIAWENDWFEEYSDSKVLNTFRQTLSENDDDFVDEHSDKFLDWLTDHYVVNTNIKQLLSLSKPEDLTLYFGTNGDDDCCAMVVFEDLKSKDRHDDNYDELLGEARNTKIGWLLAQQGYDVSDLYRNKVDSSGKTPLQRSQFLKDVYDELYSYTNVLQGLQLVAIPDSSDWNTIEAIAKGKAATIKAGTTFGLFNRIHGGGSGLSITLEKDMTLLPNDVYDIGIARSSKPYDYSPDAVYGLARTSKEQLAVVSD